MFTFNEVEEKRIEEFRQEHKCCISRDAMGMKYTYHITPGGIGTATEVECNICKKTKNITDYDCW